MKGIVGCFCVDFKDKIVFGVVMYIKGLNEKVCMKVFIFFM